MRIKILKANLGRAYAAQDMACASAKRKDIDLLVVSEPTKKRVSESQWIKDNIVNMAVLLLND